MSQLPKQVIGIRTDLRTVLGHKPRTGKIAAMASHASLAAMLSLSKPDENGDLVLNISKLPEAVRTWITNKFTKVVVAIPNEVELHQIYNQAVELNLPCSLIVDEGLTEFGGNKNAIAIAVGPGDPAVIDRITRHLSLL
jgi:peptidyl-tRNA hydrolase